MSLERLQLDSYKKRARLNNNTVNKLAYVYASSQFVNEWRRLKHTSSLDYFLQQVNKEEFMALRDKCDEQYLKEEV